MPVLPFVPPRIRPLAVLALALVAACGPKIQAAPEPGQPNVLPPNLSAQRVMVFPVQGTPGVRGPVDDELRFALESREEGPIWISVDRMREVVRMSPASRVPLDDLPVSVFLRGEVTRVGDPLYGILRRAGALADADIALIPVEARARADTPDTPGAVEIRVALIHVLSGRVVWYGVEEGTAGAGTDPAALASAMEAMARRLVPGVGT